MKQNILMYHQPHLVEAETLCVGRLLLAWGLYGIAMAVLWDAAGLNPWAQSAVWLVGLAVAPAIALRELAR